MMSKLGDQFPDKVRLAPLEKRGAVFRMLDRQSGKSRFFFILNRDPSADDSLLVVTCTSQIGDNLRRFGKDAVEIITPEEYPPLSMPSLITFKSIHRFAKERLAARVTDWCDPLPETVLKRLQNAVSKSRVVSRRDKRTILGEES